MDLQVDYGAKDLILVQHILYVQKYLLLQQRVLGTNWVPRTQSSPKTFCASFCSEREVLTKHQSRNKKT